MSPMDKVRSAMEVSWYLGEYAAAEILETGQVKGSLNARRYAVGNSGHHLNPEQLFALLDEIACPATFYLKSDNQDGDLFISLQRPATPTELEAAQAQATLRAQAAAQQRQAHLETLYQSNPTKFLAFATAKSVAS